MENLEKEYESHISADEYAELTEGLVDASLYDDHLSPEAYEALTAGLLDPENLNWEEHGDLLTDIFPDMGM